MPKDDLYNRIIREYKKCGSVKQTALNVGTSLVRAQRVLITEGLWSSDTSDAVYELYVQGKTVQEIADELNVSVKTVQAYLPYSKGFYSSSNKSTEAKRSDRYRSRKAFAADNQINHSQTVEPNNMTAKTTPICERVQDKRYRVSKLRLELIVDKKDRQLMNVLRKYAKVKEGIVREILVPSEISLHKLNYAIQRAFGWQNSHLHQFSLPSKVFAELTGGKYDGEEDERYSMQNGSFMKWVDYCGTYFRFPTEDYDDLYWDDDYDGDVSIKSWFRRKYNGYNYYGGYCEHFVCARKEADDFIQEYPIVRIDPYYTDPSARDVPAGQYINKLISETTVREVGVMFEMHLDSLLERLRLDEVLQVKGAPNVSKKQLETFVRKRNALYKACLEKYIDLESGETASSSLLPWREDEERVLPITDELIYRYDFGDGWGVKITCEEQYYFKDRLDDANGHYVPVSLDDQVWLNETRVYNQRDEQIFGEERETIVDVGYSRKLRCIYSDGLNVLDDVGGIYGFADFLEELHEGEPEERESCKLWSSNMGWTGRDAKPKSVL